MGNCGIMCQKSFLFVDLFVWLYICSLFCLSHTQGHQLRGIRGLFKRSSKYSVDTNSGGPRKRSFSDHLLRRTASAPAKGRKKTKMPLSESVASISDQRNGMDAMMGDEGTSGKEEVVERRLQPRAPLTHRPASMPLDRLLQERLSICSPEKDQQHMGADTVIGGHFTIYKLSKSNVYSFIFKLIYAFF